MMLHFNRMHRYGNVIEGFCYASVGETLYGFTLGPTYVCTSVNAQWVMRTVRRGC